MRYGTSIIIDSDAHCENDVGNHEMAHRLLADLHFPEELVVNTSLSKAAAFIPSLGPAFKGRTGAFFITHYLILREETTEHDQLFKSGILSGSCRRAEFYAGRQTALYFPAVLKQSHFQYGKEFDVVLLTAPPADFDLCGAGPKGSGQRTFGFK